MTDLEIALAVQYLAKMLDEGKGVLVDSEITMTSLESSLEFTEMLRFELSWLISHEKLVSSRVVKVFDRLEEGRGRLVFRVRFADRDEDKPERVQVIQPLSEEVRERMEKVCGNPQEVLERISIARSEKLREENRSRVQSLSRMFYC